MDHHHVELSTLGVIHHLRELRPLADVVHTRRAPLFDVLAQARPAMILGEGTEGPDLSIEAVTGTHRRTSIPGNRFNVITRGRTSFLAGGRAWDKTSASLSSLQGDPTWFR